MTRARVVVVGSGIAGLTVALRAVDAGHEVTLVTKDVLEHANTRFAQGGIAGVMFADDRVEDHVRDTLIAGAGLADEEAVRVLCDEGPARIRELIAAGVAFDRGEDGELAKGLEAAHSYPRVLHAGGDATGSAIEQALVSNLRNTGAAVLEHAFLVDLVLHNGRLSGVELFVGDSTHRTLRADAVVLATGGAGELYSHTTNPPVATGDTPPMEGGFGSADGLTWIEETVPVAPSFGDTVSDLYKYIYLAIREGQPFPVKNDEAFEVVRVTEMIRKNSKF